MGRSGTYSGCQPRPRPVLKTTRSGASAASPCGPSGGRKRRSPHARSGPAPGLLSGNSAPEAAKATVIRREWFEVVEDYPRDVVAVRYWDLAATEDAEADDPDWTAGVKVVYKDGIYWVVHVERFQRSPRGTERGVRQTAETDGKAVTVGVEQDPGQAGKAQVDHYQRRVLPGFEVSRQPCYRREEREVVALCERGGGRQREGGAR